MAGDALPAVTAGYAPPQGAILISGNALGLLLDGTMLSSHFVSTGYLLTVNYQWFADGIPVLTAGYADGVRLDSSFAGKQVSVTISGVDKYGGQYSFSSNSLPVLNLNNAPSGLLTISGTQTVGSVLHVSSSVTDWDGMGTLSYQWRADGNAIDGATSADWTLAPAQAGKTISVVASYVDGEGHQESVSSIYTPHTDKHPATLAVNGTVAAGQTLQAVISDPDGIASAYYQWQVSDDGQLWTNLAGATSASVTLGAIAPAMVRVVTDSVDAGGDLNTLNLMVGTERADMLPASGTDIAAGGGDDIIYGPLYSGRVDGGAGRDTFVSPTPRDFYLWSHTGEHVWSLGGTTLVDVERVKFSDVSLALDTDGNAGQAYRLYQAAFNRAPDLIGMGFWMNQLDQGSSATAIASAFVQSDEFIKLAGASAGNADLVTLFYQNILHRAPDASGYQNWVDLLDRHVVTVADVLVAFSNSAENVAALAPVLDNGIAYTPYVTVPAAPTPPNAGVWTVPAQGAVFIGGSALGLLFEGRYAGASTVFSGDLTSVNYQWLVDGAQVATGPASSVMLLDAWAGKQISVTVSGIDSTGAKASFSSNSLPVINVNSVSQPHVDHPGTVSFAGTLAAGQTLHASVLDPDGVDAVFYQWQGLDTAGHWVNLANGTGSDVTLGATAPVLVRVLTDETDNLGGVDSRVTFLGTNGDDSIHTAYRGGTLYAAGGNDTIYDTGESSIVDGGAGLDTYVTDYGQYFYSIYHTGTHQWSIGGLIHADADLVDVERIQFAGGALALDTDGVAGQAYRLYQAAFDRVPDAVGIGFWISRLDKGDSLVSVADAFVHSTEFTTLYGASPASADLVTGFYRNILHRAPEPVGFQFWVDALDHHSATVAEVLAQFSDSPENVAALVGVMDHGITYVPHA